MAQSGLPSYLATCKSILQPKNHGDEMENSYTRNKTITLCERYDPSRNTTCEALGIELEFVRDDTTRSNRRIQAYIFQIWRRCFACHPGTLEENVHFSMIDSLHKYLITHFQWKFHCYCYL